MYCEKCGHPVKESEPVCSHCGAKNTYYKAPDENNPKTNNLLIMLLIFITVTILAVGALILWRSLSSDAGKQPDPGVSVEESSSLPAAAEESSSIESVPADESSESSESSMEQEAESQASSEEESSAPTESAQSIQENITEESESESPAEAAFSPISMAHIIATSESSYLKESDPVLLYPAASAIDGDPSTGWCEDVSGYGEGEWIELTFDETYLLSGMRIAIGLQTDSDRYYNNSRPREIRITFSNGTEILAELEDRMGYQTIAFEEPVASSNLKVAISAVYRGSQYDDTLISEIELY